MTTKFQRYEFKEINPQKPNTQGSQPNFQEYDPTVFAAHPSQLVDEMSKQKLVHFRVDPTVSSHLGLDLKEKALFEAKLTKEIEIRWAVAKDQAEAEGYIEGLLEGKHEAVQAEAPRILERLNRFDQLLQEFENMRASIFVKNETFLMELLGQIARMIVLREVEIDKEYIHRVVISLLGQIGTKEDIKIYLSNEDMQVVDSLREAVTKEFGKLSNTSFELGKDLVPGSCKIETRFGVVDTSLQVQIENVMKALRT